MTNTPMRAHGVSFLFAASTLLLFSASAESDSQTDNVWTLRNPQNTRSSDGMIVVPTGDYRVFFKRPSGVESIPVDAFYVDDAPVTKRQYLEFVRDNPQWRRSAVRTLVAEPAYLRDWDDELNPGDDLDAPVTYVSWFGARAYCAKQGRHLPTVAQWERFAGEPLTGDASVDAQPVHAVPFQFAMGRTAADLRGTALKFAAIWEWTEDFNSAPALVAEGASPGDKPRFCGDGLRSNNSVDYAAFLRFSFRSSLRGNYTLKNLGFRCAR